MNLTENGVILIIYGQLQYIASTEQALQIMLALITSCGSNIWQVDYTIQQTCLHELELCKTDLELCLIFFPKSNDCTLLNFN